MLIDQSDILNRLHPSSVICPITMDIKDGVSILRVNLNKGTGGLKSESAIMIDQVRAIADAVFKQYDF
ncbi:type II toxin-antitoxin system PemK/MazF family toxin [Cryomorpha ignava]|uniref:Type II toxin-antitoxin system PemK/MazF family toxin n=1 Tax=Cryomorpha ignava TaxID=101383 RepID=A0A7K3WME3_9FLAO|nr:type II toxin-antitoxin system PemK/MazF family toxin [Cryomorpha ignava]